MLTGSTVFAQKPADPKSENQTDPTNKIYSTSEILPEFPGGMPAFSKFLQKNYQYSKEAREHGVFGRVIMSFVVEKDGSLTDIKVLKDLGFGTGEEAVRLLKKSPKWKPGIQNGRLVKVAYVLPIKLDSSIKNKN